MPNALEYEGKSKKILIWGASGVGKTTQILTFPGKKFVFSFDPSGIESLKGFNIDYETFLVDETNINTSSLSGKIKDNTAQKMMEPKAFNKFAQAWRTFARSGRYKEYDVVIFDTFTNMSLLAMDRMIFLNDREGAFPHLDDYGPAGSTTLQVLRWGASLPNTTVIFLTHEYEEEQTSYAKQKAGIQSNKITKPFAYGQVRTALPNLMSDAFRLITQTQGDTITYHAQTAPPSSQFQGIKCCSVRGIDPVVDITIGDFSKPEEFGLGKILFG